MQRHHHCPAGVRTTLIRNIAARGRKATFVLRTSTPVAGTVEVRNGPLPFFLGSHRTELALVDGLEVGRGFFDASFELAVTAAADVQLTIE